MFRINANIPSLIAQRELNTNSNLFAKTVQRLSTGLRIVDPGDDPSGLISSETFRSSISSTSQATQNCQEAVNLVKTAEGALDEVSRLLRDARTLAVASSNGATLSSEQRAANQAQLNSINESITRISKNTQYGKSNLLDGSAGVYAGSTALNTVEKIHLNGSFSGNPITNSANITLDLTQRAKRAIVEGKTFPGPEVLFGAGSFSINGYIISTSETDTVRDVVKRIEQAGNSTGVQVQYQMVEGQSTTVTFVTATYGADQKIEIIDKASMILADDDGGNPQTNVSANGQNAVANVTLEYASGKSETVTFDRGSGTLLKDNLGNSIQLTSRGASELFTGLGAGKVNPGVARFQIGPNSGHMLNFNLGNFVASQLGDGVAGNLNMTNASLLTPDDAQTAINVIDRAIQQVSVARGNYGNFQRNVLETNLRSLEVSKLNMVTSESTIRDCDMAIEMSELSRSQILQNAGIAVLGQANSAPGNIISLLNGAR